MWIFLNFRPATRKNYIWTTLIGGLLWYANDRNAFRFSIIFNCRTSANKSRFDTRIYRTFFTYTNSCSAWPEFLTSGKITNEISFELYRQTDRVILPGDTDNIKANIILSRNSFCVQLNRKYIVRTSLGGENSVAYLVSFYGEGRNVFCIHSKNRKFLKILSQKQRLLSTINRHGTNSPVIYIFNWK